MKGILFGGCSFTWGQGLYYYSNLDNKPVIKKNSFNIKDLTWAHIRYKDSTRFPRIIANYFKTFEVVKEHNGGCEDETFDSFFKNIFDKTNLKYETHSEKYNFEDIDYIILQLSDPARNLYEYQEIVNNELVKKSIRVGNHPTGHPDLLDFEKFLIKNNVEYEDWYNNFLKVQTTRIKNELEIYESKGIKTKIISWQKDYPNYLKVDEWLSKRYLEIEYDGKKFDSIDSLTNYDNSLIISNDFDNFHNPPEDHHITKRCHSIIADTIIKSIKKDLYA